LKGCATQPEQKALKLRNARLRNNSQGFKAGEQNIAKRPDIRAKISAGLHKRWADGTLHHHRERHDLFVVETVENLKSLGYQIIFADAPGFPRPDIIARNGDEFLNLDVKPVPYPHIEIEGERSKRR